MKKLYNISIAKVIISYLWVTYLLYLTIPYNLPSQNINELYTIIFLLCVSISIYLGARSVKIVKRPELSYNRNYSIISPNVYLFLNILVFINVSLYITEMVNNGIASMSLSFGENYSTYRDAEISYNSRTGQIFNLLSPLRFFLMGYGTYMYNQYGKLQKISFILMIISVTLFTFFQGKQVGFAYDVCVLGTAFFIRKIKDNQSKKAIYVFLLLIILFIAIFVISQISRHSVTGFSISDNVTNENNIFYIIFGPIVGAGVLQFIMYMTHGYVGLNYCLQLPFKWTYGYGGSMAIDSYLNQYLGFPNQLMNTYPLRMEQVFGWPGLTSWPTAFAWWASDLSFFGVVVFMYFFTRFICILFKEGYYYSNPYSIVLLTFLSIQIISLPLNNQLLQTRPMLISTVVLIILWMIKRRKWNNMCKSVPKLYVIKN